MKAWTVELYVAARVMLALSGLVRVSRATPDEAREPSGYFGWKEKLRVCVLS